MSPLRRDNKPYSVRLLNNFARWLYTRWVLVPQFDSVGTGLEVIGPHRLEVYGKNIHLGEHVHMQTAKGNLSRLCTWANGNDDGSPDHGRIDIGSHSLLTPGLQIVSAHHVRIGDNVMIASRVYISDADWHGLYDRLASPGQTAPITLCDNVWLGEGVKVCKGVTIGENSVIGAGAVVTKDIPANVVAAGNPAKVVKPLDETHPMVTRAALFEDIKTYNKTMCYLHYLNHKSNNYISWIRQLIRPSRKG
ncbi:MAG: acyltransferase [Alphaproteobacteria bacterium]|nr:acyltransferase [Alphaproteobacteria bacterium]